MCDVPQFNDRTSLTRSRSASAVLETLRNRETRSWAPSAQDAKGQLACEHPRPLLELRKRAVTHGMELSEASCSRATRDDWNTVIPEQIRSQRKTSDGATVSGELFATRRTLGGLKSETSVETNGDAKSVDNYGVLHHD